jgi:hypothetical protein
MKTNLINLGGKKMGDKAVTIGSQPTYEILDENTLTSDSDRALPTQKSVKAYVDSSLGIGGITASAAEINKLARGGRCSFYSMFLFGITIYIL